MLHGCAGAHGVCVGDEACGEIVVVVVVVVAVVVVLLLLLALVGG